MGNIQMKRMLVIIGSLAVCGLLAAWLAFANVSLAALPEPGKRETYLAVKAKHMLIARAAKESSPPRPSDRVRSAAEGDKVFAIRCSLCHGEDGRSQTPLGQRMYPRAADLSSADTQNYSDAELFWVIRNGIRLSGMPGFAGTETDDHIWNMVDYLRALNPRKN
jgi:mono/diheme cytochrome c family protein